MDSEDVLYYISISITIVCGVIITIIQYTNNLRDPKSEVKLNGVDILQVIKESRVSGMQFELSHVSVQYRPTIYGEY